PRAAPAPGAPAAPTGIRLRLLPSGPDLVHEPASRGTRAISTAFGELTPQTEPLKRGFGLARADCERQGTATSPPSTVRGKPSGSGRVGRTLEAPLWLRHTLEEI